MLLSPKIIVPLFKLVAKAVGSPTVRALARDVIVGAVGNKLYEWFNDFASHLTHHAHSHEHQATAAPKRHQHVHHHLDHAYAH